MWPLILASGHHLWMWKEAQEPGRGAAGPESRSGGTGLEGD